MNRRDLHSAFTKINLWRQTQFRKIVYVDADIVAFRAPDELFDLPHTFSAAPDIGWPDLFNTGLMVLTPNLGDYHALLAMAQKGVSFDGADQGLLNMYFKNDYNRLSFSYNVTPSAHYQYLPAYRHFQSTISMVHFIGREKPWLQGRDRAFGDSPFDQMLGRWWAVYDRHYRREASRGEPSQPEQRVPEIVQYFVKGEFQPTVRYVVPVGEPPSEQFGNFQDQQYQAHDMQHLQQQQQRQHTHQAEAFSGELPHQHHDQPHGAHEQAQQHHPDLQMPRSPKPLSHQQHQVSDHQRGPQPPSQPGPQPQVESTPSWDAQRQPPPLDSKPEAMNFPQTHYAMSSDTAPFVPPERYPTPPKNMWYEMPKARPAKPEEKPKPIFPWETHRPKPTRVFASVTQLEAPATGPAAKHIGEASEPPQGSHITQAQPAVSGSSSQSATQQQPGEPHTPPLRQPSPLQSLPPQPSPPKPSPPGPSPRPARPAPAATATDIWSSFPRTNAWDNVPEINRYVDRALQRHRRSRSRNLALAGGSGDGKEAAAAVTEEFGYAFAPARRGSKVTDFPSEDDRPSLPVTPAPIRRPRRWGSGTGGDFGGGGGTGEGREQLSAAEGVPGQADWVCVHGIRWTPADCLCELANILRSYKDPAAQLQKLAKEQSELLLRRLGGGGRGDNEGKEEVGAGKGSQGEKAQRGEIPLRPLPFGSEGIRSPTYVAPTQPAVVSPTPIKPHTGTSPVNRFLAAAPDIAPSQESSAATGAPQGPVPAIPSPSYRGPGAAFEKGEDVPTFETPALPTEEERDILET
ncbi:glycosyltransferase family 8 protein [Thermothelomyces thermophilus ATCC 42464]|uniref:glycogenin glucosyltransferase n=1 Tax=Thermothelomyces thermophilus (strain ATCC 42464 / BCRC 31852 / DSM 1799) TaxID=573729 RepID=G2Q9F3_THET4|nr:glycosyltransferase family 8 protein [Thermothelomyces thermophilus ATCC 42464]AEO56412.1 glycosyltransferase family 8 protein [Thermothelomyces thermophilus ATCC 42464]